MKKGWNTMHGDASQEYTPLPQSEKATSPRIKQRQAHWSRWSIIGFLTGIVVTVFGLHGLASSLAGTPHDSCDTIDHGYRCSPKTTHFWGQYSLWFSVPSKIDVAPPKDCKVTFANVLSRHGGRDPTIGKTLAYGVLIADIQSKAKQYPGKYEFLKHYEYTLGADQLTDAGRQEMVNSGVHFYRRYEKLIKKHTPFVRAGGQQRVIESAQMWLRGISRSTGQPPEGIDLTIPEGPKWNNTLSHDTCPAFDEGPSHGLGERAQHIWVKEFVPPIRHRVNSELGTNLSMISIVYLMDMCPFDTLAHPDAKMSEFCHLFTDKEWHAYDYYQTLGKYYGYSVGNPLGATQGVGYVNELLARLTEKPVEDNTNTNSTLDSDPKTFPLDRKVYADFSHDNDISGVLAALGLYNETKPLSNTTIESTKDTGGFSAAWTVPFASRLYVEKLQCKHEEEEYVRIIVNDRVHPMKFCDADKHGRCKLSKFVESQEFARTGGNWGGCFT